jgi:hypothetical protein
MKNIQILLLLFLYNPILKGQTLDEINFSPNASIPLNTFTTGINNKGFVCGYYTNAFGSKVGYVINSEGKPILFDGGVMNPIFTDVSVEGINDTNTIIINATNASGITILKGYYNTTTEKYDLAAVVGSGQPNVAKPFAINNFNVYAGWYPNTTQRWLFALNDSNVSNISTWNADVWYNSGFYPTYALGINDDDLLCGYYIDGASVVPIIYDLQTSLFDILPFTNNMKIHDINNDNKICGEYKQANGTYSGFYANYVPGSINNFTSINTIFDNTTIQNVINGMNDSGAYVGSYFHPVSNTWVGFIYRPNQTEYRLPKFSYAKDTWRKLQNSNGTGPLDVFTPAYYKNFKYKTVDPFMNNGFPLLNPIVSNIVNTPTNYIGVVDSDASVSWKGFGKENLLAQLSYTCNVNYYENNLKPLLFQRYYSQSYFGGFNGYCFGFSYSALFKKYRPNLMNLWYGIAPSVDISQVTNTDTVAILGIERAYLKQFDPDWNAKMFKPGTHFQDLYRLKNEMLKDSTNTSPFTLGFFLGTAVIPTGAHDLLPYKIRTPKKFPFVTSTYSSEDTLFLYDSNYPNDSSQYVSISAPYVNKYTQYFYSPTYNNIYRIDVKGVGIRENIVLPFSNLKKTRLLQDTTFSFAINNNLQFTITNNSLDQLQFDGSNYTNNCTNIIAHYPRAKNITLPISYQSDTISNFNMATSNYLDSSFQWSIAKSLLCMGISRKALPTQKDNSTVNHRMITYGNPDIAFKKLNCYFIQTKEDGTKATTVLINDFVMQAGDSIVTENPKDFEYKITKISSGSATYNLTTYTFTNDSAKQFVANNIPLVGGSSHTVESFFGNTKTVVFVDKGLNNVNDDTLFVPEVPLSNLQNSNINNYDITLYPVPVKNELNIIANYIPKTNYNIIIASIEGKIVYNQMHKIINDKSLLKVNTSSFISGKYVCFIQDEKGNVVYKRLFAKD